MIPPFPQDVTLITRTKSGTDTFGNDTYTETLSTIKGAVAPAVSTEVTAAGETVTTHPTLYAPPGTTITSIDAVQIDGLQYEVDGEPEVWNSPMTGEQFGIAAHLQRVTG